MVAVVGIAAAVALSAFFLDIHGSDPADGEWVCQLHEVPIALMFAQPVAFVLLLMRSAEKATAHPAA